MNNLYRDLFEDDHLLLARLEEDVTNELQRVTHDAANDVGKAAANGKKNEKIYIAHCIPQSDDNYVAHCKLSRGIPYYKMPFVRLNEKEAEKMIS